MKVLKVVNIKGFTLVELIVVITILAILGTIGFISLQGFSRSARDSARISDLNSIARALDYFELEHNFYPDPTDFFEVSYSGSLAWKQGNFGNTTRISASRISGVPTDPLTGNNYAYSTTNTKQEYELGSIIEANLFSVDLSIPGNIAYADNSFFSYIKGNYNKQIVSVKQEDRLYVLGVPTIITTEITDVTVENLLTNQSFAIRGSKNLPASYASSLPVGQTHSGSTTFTPGSISLTAPLLYEGGGSTLDDAQEKQDFGENIVSYYSESNLGSTDAYDNLGTIDAGEEFLYVNTLISGNVGGLSSDEINLSNSNSSVTTGESGEAISCMDMSNTQLTALNNWGDAFIAVEPTDVSAFIFSGTPSTSYTKTEWCSVTTVDYFGVDGLVTTMIDEIGLLTNLNGLSMQDTSIPSLPQEFADITTLQNINFFGNPSLGNLNGVFDVSSPETCDSVGEGGATICVEGNGTTIDITFTSI